MHMHSVYLAGPIRGLSYHQSVNWREHAREYLQPEITTYSPMRYKDMLIDEPAIDAFGVQYTHPLTTPKGIISRDRHDVMHCDLLLVNVLGATKVGIGTCMEIAWADLLRKPIILAMEENNIHHHPMLCEAVGYIVPTLEEALTLTRQILLP